ncbi:hypothetical protein C8J35_103504 [Rhizobium sp. PP-F2F-G38]|nr:hypothetical protein C8J35_103504 [Rhizobium sp. PP-F2F-G38]
MFNRSQIMKAAWVRFRNIRVNYHPTQIKRMGADATFGGCLKTEWRIAKADAAKEARQRKIDALLNSSQADTMRGLLTALENVQYLSFRYRAADHREAIERQIETLLGEAA